MIIVAFAIIITIAALIVIYFRISDSIRDDMKDIGILKAMGYTSRQINASVMLQFLCVAAAGTIIGILVSYLALPLISNMFMIQTGLIWNQGFAPVTSFVCLFIILSAVVLNVYFSLSRLKRLHPVAAIREDTKTRGVKKNYFRLEKTNLSLQFAMACKLITQNLRQNIIIALVITSVTYASAFGLVFYYNMAVDSETFMTTIGGELCSVVVVPLSNENTARLREEISVMPGVNKAIFYDGSPTIIEEESFYATITEDFSDLEGQLLYEGIYPKSSNEIAVGGIAAERLGKSLGDTIMVKSGDESAEYLICGFIQSGNYAGKIIALTIDGINRIEPDFVPGGINIYLQEGEDAAVLIEQLENRYSGIINTPMNLDELLEGQTRSYVTIVSLMAIVVLIITGIIVALVLYFVIKTMIVRRKRDFGVQKALGYTTFQLVQQISLSFLPVVLAGAIAGVVLGYLGISPMISSLFKSVGIMRFDMLISGSWMAMLCVMTVLLTYVTAVVISSRIRKLSAYVLVTE
jgi:putative ABC transport system permease protein